MKFAKQRKPRKIISDIFANWFRRNTDAVAEQAEKNNQLLKKLRERGNVT